MGGREYNFQVVYRGETLPFFVEGGWVFFQRLKEYGGGYWLGRTYHDAFVFGFDRPISLSQGLDFIFAQEIAERKRNEPPVQDDDQNYSLF